MTNESVTRDVLVLVLTSIAVGGIDAPTRKSELWKIKLFVCVSCCSQLIHDFHHLDLFHSPDDHRRLPFPSCRLHRLQCPHRDRFLLYPMDMILISVAGEFLGDFVAHRHHDFVAAAGAVGGCAIAVVDVGNIFGSSLAPSDVSRDFHTTIL